MKNIRMCPISSQEKRFTINGFTYAAQLWESSGQLPVIALHGWLDNSGSFDVLAPQLNISSCLALDLAGHGFSDRQPGLVDYPVWSEVAAIYAIADEMGWPRFGLMGHSRGAMMAIIAAGAYPERISHVVLLDGMLPPPVEAEAAIDRMVGSIHEIRRRIHRKMSLYESYDAAINARCTSRFAPVKRKTAEILAVRGLAEVDGRFHWHVDGKLWALSNVAMTGAVIDRFVTNITAPVLLVLGSVGLLKQREADEAVAMRNKRAIEQMSAKVVVFSDGHFLHMEDSAADIADEINHFLTAE